MLSWTMLLYLSALNVCSCLMSSEQVSNIEVVEVPSSSFTEKYDKSINSIHTNIDEPKKDLQEDALLQFKYASKSKVIKDKDEL